MQHTITNYIKNESIRTTQPTLLRQESTNEKPTAEETMLDRQNNELSKVEQELEQLRQIAKQHDLSRIQYAIVMLLMELNEIKHSKNLLNEVSLLHWRKLPKDLQRRITSESAEHKKSDIFNIKRVKHEKLLDITSETVKRTLQPTDDSHFSNDEREDLRALIKSLTNETYTEKDTALEFLTQYFHRQIFESMWTNIEKLIYKLCSSHDNSLSTQSVMNNLKSLMAMFIYLDSRSLAEICKELLQLCQEHTQDETDRFHLPATKLEQLQTNTLENAIRQRANQLEKFNPCDKSNLISVLMNEIQAYELIHICPCLTRLYERHATLTRILHDQSNYNQSISIQLAYLRLSDCIALLFPELPILFMESLQLDHLNFEKVQQLKNYLLTDQFRTSIEQFNETRFSIKNNSDASFLLLSNDQSIATKLLMDSIRSVVEQMTIAAGSTDMRKHWFHQLTESNEYHSFFALEIQAFLSKLINEMKENLLTLKEKLDPPENFQATNYIKFSESIMQQCGEDLRRCQARKAIIKTKLSTISYTFFKEAQLKKEDDDANNEYSRIEREYQNKLNQVANENIRQLLAINRQLQKIGDYLASDIIEIIEDRKQESTESKKNRPMFTSSEFYAYLYQSKAAILKMTKADFQLLTSRVHEFIDKVSQELKNSYDDYQKALLWLTSNDNLYCLFKRFLLTYILIHTQFFNSIRNWLYDIDNQRKPYMDEIEKTINQTNQLVSESLKLVEPIIGASQISSITMTIETVYHSVKELSQIAFQIEKFADTARVVYSSRVLSILLYHCSSIYARLSIFLVQLFKTQQLNPLIFAQLKTMSFKIDQKSYEWDDYMKKLLILSGFRERSDLPGLNLPVDEFTLKQIHKHLSYDFPQLRYSLKLRYTHAFANICSNPAAMIDDIERKMKGLLRIGDSNDGAGRTIETISKTNPLVQVSYNLNVLVNNIQHLIGIILENLEDKFELETLKNLKLFLIYLKEAIYLSCSSSFDIINDALFNFIHKDQLDLLFDHAFLFIRYLYNERKQLVEPLSHIRSILDNFVDQFIVFFIQLLQQQQQQQINYLQEQYNKTIKTRLNLEDIHLLETLSKENLVHHLRHIENIDVSLDWYNQLAQFLIQGWAQASNILRSFTAPTTGNNDSISKRLRYSFVFKLLNDEGQQILLFLQQTIAQLKEKYPTIEMINDEPVIVYLIRLTKLLRYELLRMSAINLNALKIHMSRTICATLRPTLEQIQSITDEWNEEVNRLLAQRNKINENRAKQMKENYRIRSQAVEEENKDSKNKYDLKCQEVQKTIERTKKHSIEILNDIKLIGRLLHEAKFQSNHFEIDDLERLLGDTVQIVKQLFEIQRTIPHQCRFDENNEKELMKMICVESICIKVTRVEYSESQPMDTTDNFWNMNIRWDSLIRLIREGNYSELIVGQSKPLDHIERLKSVNDLFTYDIPMATDNASALSLKRWVLILYAGDNYRNKWTKMAHVPLNFKKLPFDKQLIIPFGNKNASRIILDLTPKITVQLLTNPIESDLTTTTIIEDSFLKLQGEFQTLSSLDRRIKINELITDITNKCVGIEQTYTQKYIMPLEPKYKSIPPPETVDDWPIIAMKTDKESLNMPSPPAHNFLMNELLSKYKLLEETIVQTIDILNTNINENEIDRIQHNSIRGFESAEILKEELKLFQEIFGFEKLLETLSTLYQTSIRTQKSLQTGLKFQQLFSEIYSNLWRNCFLVELSENEGNISSEMINKLSTVQMRQLLCNGNTLITNELNFGIQIYRSLISIEINFIQLMIHPLETKEHCEKAIELIEKIKTNWLTKDHQILIDEKQLDRYQIIIDETITLLYERKKQIRSIIQQIPLRLNNFTEISKAVNVNSLIKSTGSPSTSKITINKQIGEYYSSHSSIIIQFEQIIQNWSYAQLKTKTVQIVNQTDEEIDFEINSISIERSLSLFTIHHSSTIIDQHDSTNIKITPNTQINEGKYREEWQLKLSNHRLNILLIICCEIKQFDIGIDLPLMETALTGEHHPYGIKTYVIDFGTALACSQTPQQRSFTIENPMSLDLRVKFRRENGATGIFE
ncbi:unnamed protein product, partial [Rotaria sp. Silwood2]